MNIYRKAAGIKLFITDVDGVLSDGIITYDVEGREIKNFNARDGMMMYGLSELGIKTAIITGRDTPIVNVRAAELRVAFVRQGARNKLEVLKEIISLAEVEIEETSFIGDDVNDVGVMRAVGLSFAPADAHFEAKKAADYVTRAGGGAGAVREAGEMILSAAGLRDKWLARYGI